MAHGNIVSAKYSKMLEKNKQERVARAIRVIREMSENGEQLVVCDLVKKTGYSQTFFYKNQGVSIPGHFPSPVRR